MNQLHFHTEPLLIFNHFGQNFDGSVSLLSASKHFFRLISNTDLNNPWNQDVLTVDASIVILINTICLCLLWFIWCLLMYFTGHSIERTPTHRLSPSVFVLLLLCLFLSVSPSKWPSIQEWEMSSLWVGVWVYAGDECELFEKRHLQGSRHPNHKKDILPLTYSGVSPCK